jgi:tRNA-2-methylthio-N6-dimethylallyladenosine synthase
MSPHPRDFTDDVIATMAETSNVMPALHMPLQSGSDSVLQRMRRSYRRDRYLGIIDRVRAAMPSAAITTDIIVGFPGETEEEFLDTLSLVEQVRFSGAYTFQYSKRPGTPAATMPDQIPKAVVQERYERLIERVNDITWQLNLELVGTEVEVLVAHGEGRKDRGADRLTGRAADGRLVHVEMNEKSARPGDFVTAKIQSAAPHHLLAEHIHTRQTKAGDFSDDRPSGPAVMLGIPSFAQ